MNSLVKYETRGGVAVITIDNPPVNALSPGVPEGIAAGIDTAASDGAVTAIVLIGGGRTFIAGADIAVLQEIAWSDGPTDPLLHDSLKKIEDSAKPVVMAIHGSALGGGLEVAMAGHFRVALPSAQFGQPEVNLGLIPGAEGTQRLPRLVGIEKAIEMCVSGKPITASEALGLGLIDAVVDGDLASSAVAFASNASAGLKTRDRTGKLGTPETNAALFASGRLMAAKTKPHQQAPLRALEAIEAAAVLPFDEGCAREQELFHACMRSDQAKAMMHAFFAERAVSKIPGVDKTTKVYPVDRIGIIGAGTMGGGIAMCCANAGIPVLLKETETAALEAGMSVIRRNYENSVKRGRLSEQEMQQRLALIHPRLDYQGFDSVDVIIEAVFENMAIKKSVFKEIDAIARAGCILASNTSTLSIDEIASVTSRRELVIGLHFFSPANVMRLLEIVRGKATSPEAIATAMALAKQLKKTGVLVGNCPGFVGNRMMFPYMCESQLLVEDGATPNQVDSALTSFGMAMGIFAVEDLTGIDIAFRMREELGNFTAPGSRKPMVQEKLCALGRYGQKTGKGWYRYGANREAMQDPEVSALIEQTAVEAGIVRREIPDQEILDRCIYALINEGARALEEGFALRAADIDVVYLNGYGFPGWRGGPMFYADKVGLSKVLETVKTFHELFGDRWAPAPLLKNLAAEERSFRDYDKGPKR